MLSKRNLERTAGLILLALLASLIVSFATSVEIDIERGFEFGESLVDIATHPRQYTGSLALGIVADLLAVALGAAVYLVFRSHERNLALLGAFAFVAAGATFMVADVAAIALRSLAEDFLKALSTGSTQTISIESSARGVAVFWNFGVLAGTTFIALALLAYGALIAWSRAIPRELGWLAVAAGALLLFFWVSPVVDVFWVVGFIGLVLTMLTMLLVGVWLITRGTKEASGV